MEFFEILVGFALKICRSLNSGFILNIHPFLFENNSFIFCIPPNRKLPSRWEYHENKIKYDHKQTISKKQLREFGILIGFGFPFLLGWLVPLLFGHGFRVWTIWIGTPGLIHGLTAPRLLFYPN